MRALPILNVLLHIITHLGVQEVLQLHQLKPVERLQLLHTGKRVDADEWVIPVTQGGILVYKSKANGFTNPLNAS